MGVNSGMRAKPPSVLEVGSIANAAQHDSIK